MGWHWHKAVQLVVDEPCRVVLLSRGDGEGLVVNDLESLDVVGELAFAVGRPLVGVVGDDVPPELHVARSELDAVAPCAVLKGDGVGE